MDRDERLDFLPAADRHTRPDLPPLEEADVNQAIHFIAPDGRVYQGADAAPIILRFLPRWRHAALLFRLPGVRSLAGRTYNWVSIRRHRLGCGPQGCGTGGDGLA
jgi:predicted DCC family thiol-disulfide oxidoreductase YuxK